MNAVPPAIDRDAMLREAAEQARALTAEVEQRLAESRRLQILHDRLRIGTLQRIPFEMDYAI